MSETQQRVDVVLTIERDGKTTVIGLTELEAAAVGFWIATGRLHADVEPTDAERVDAVETGLMGVSEA